MKLLNGSEDVPSEFYVFVNQLNPVTHHNYKYSGRFFSAGIASAELGPENLAKYLKGELNYLPFVPRDVGQVALSPYLLTAINEYRIEYDAELHRQRYHPLYPSRLAALYAFGDQDACVAVSQKYGWPLQTVRKFRLVENPLTRVIKVNMEHVSLLRHAYRVAMLDDVGSLWESYWRGEPTLAMGLPSVGGNHQKFESGTIWEYLIEGVLQKTDP